MRGLAIALCLMPLAFALPGLSEPWGNSEESLNAAIWSLGAKNLLELGPGPSLRGARVSPHPGTRGDGIYAHHPPLPVWLTAVPVALGGWEGGSRLLGLGCLTVALLLLHRILRRFFEPRAALVALAAASLSVFALRYGRLFTTLTLAAPLFLGLLCLVLERRRTAWALPLVAALVLSSWDGVAAGAVLVAVLAARDRWWAPAAVFVAALALVAWHLLDATGGPGELLWQFRWRAAGDDVTVSQWLSTQAAAAGEGLGPLALVLLFAAPFLARDREQRIAFALLLVPGLVMLVVFRQGAVRHAFWGFNLLFPAAFGVALLAARLPRLAPPLVALQLAATITWSVQHLREEHAQNELGAVARTLPRGVEVPVLARGAFHPYVSWYAQAKPVTVRTLADLGAVTTEPVLADTEHARALGCAPPAGPRWQVLSLEALRCPAITSRW